MKHALLRHTFTTIALLAIAAVAPPTASAQVAFETFDDGDVANVDVFFGGADGIGAGVGPTDGVGGDENTALSLGINPGAGGGFAGAAVVGTAGVDASGSEYLTFYVRPTTVQAANLPLVLEVNLQEDANGDGVYTGATEDEYQANYRLSTGSGYTLVQIPLASFTDDNSVNAGADDGFDFSSVINVVYAIGGIPAGPEFALAFDEIIFYEEALETPGAFAAFDTFDDGDVANVDVFFGGADGIGAGVGPTDGVGGDENTALSLGINPGAGGGFAGAAVVGTAGVDASGSEYLTFYVRPTTVQAANLPLVLEVNLQEDANGDGVYTGATEDEYQANYRLSTGSGYTLVQIPLASFTDDNSVNAGADDGFDFSSVINVVYAIGGIPAGPEFALAFDEIGFSTGITVANESDASGLPDGLLLSSAYPNPFVSEARFDVTLERSQSVRIEMFDVLGRQVRLLYEGTLAAQTPHAFEVDGRGLPSGMYLYRVTGETFSQTRSLTLLK